MKCMLLMGSMMFGVTLCSQLTAGPILVVNGATSGVSEPAVTANITNNLSSLQTSAGNSVTIVTGNVPQDLSPFSQVWDIRFNNVFALTASQQDQYLAFLQSGGGVFLMGENSNFEARNSSILNFIALAGGGSLAVAGGFCSNDVQAVNAPFTSPNAVTVVSYPCAANLNAKGSGQWITNDGGIGAGVAWSVGDLNNAPAGVLTVILDVNFMENRWGVPLQNLTSNLVNFMNTEVNQIPEPSTYAMLGMGLIVALTFRRYRRQI